MSDQPTATELRRKIEAAGWQARTIDRIWRGYWLAIGTRGDTRAVCIEDTEGAALARLAEKLGVR